MLLSSTGAVPVGNYEPLMHLPPGVGYGTPSGLLRVIVTHLGGRRAYLADNSSEKRSSRPPIAVGGQNC